MTQKTIYQIFGVKEASHETDNMELCYDVELGNTSNEHRKVQIYRDQNNRYYMLVEGGSIGTNRFSPINRQRIYFPITCATIVSWARMYLYGKELEQTLMTFDKTYNFQEIWEYKQGLDEDQTDYIREGLFKMDDDTYMLLSTSYVYPSCFESTMWSSEGIDVYVHYVTRDVALRWATERGMDRNTGEKIFGCTAVA